MLKVADRHAIEASKRLQFDEMDPALAGLALGEEGLRLLERLGGLHLGQTDLQPRFLEWLRNWVSVTQLISQILTCGFDAN